MDPRLDRQGRDDLRFRRRELAESLVDGCGIVVSASEIVEHRGVTGLGPRELRVESLQRGDAQVRGEQLEPLMRASFDEAEDEEPIGQAPVVRSRQRREFLRVGVASITPQRETPLDDALEHRAEVLKLLDRERAHAPHQLYPVRITHDERHRGGGSLFLAMRVVDEHRIHVRCGDADPFGRRLG